MLQKSAAQQSVQRTHSLRSVQAGGDSMAFSSIFLAWGFSCSQTESQPAPSPLSQAVSAALYQEDDDMEI